MCPSKMELEYQHVVWNFQYFLLLTSHQMNVKKNYFLQFVPF